jgi:antitoxin (DNA-binding transcriptional repressor) of toxin-antitoxin stability system
MQVSMQEFKSHLSRYVVEAQSGQLIELTSHRKVVAHLIGVPVDVSAGLSCLLATGAATWQGGKPAGAEFCLQAQGVPVSAMVLEDRG